MAQVWKFPIYANSVQSILMPKGAQILSVQTQQGSPVIWAIVDPAADKEKRIFSVYGTGHNMPKDGLKYVGTWQESNQYLVWHLFEVVNHPQGQN